MGIISVFRKNMEDKSKVNSKIKDVTPFQDLKEVTSDVLNLFSMHEKPAYRSHIAKHLLGSRKIELRNDKHHNTLKQTYAAHTDYSEKDIYKIIFYLVNHGLLKVHKKNQHYLYEIRKDRSKTDLNEILEGFESFRRPKDVNAFLQKHLDKTEFIETKKKTEASLTTIKDDKLYAMLSKYRKRQAEQQKIPAYAVLHNKSLQMIAITKPTSTEGLRSIKGIGKAKVHKYGEDIVRIINQHRKSLGNEKDTKTKSIKSLLSANHYISKKESVKLYNKVKSKQIAVDEKNKEYFTSLEALEAHRNELNEKYIQKALISEKDYLDNILKQSDPNILLDQKQREVVLRDEDYTLVIAGAGAGKTTTVAAKVKYLVDKKNIDPSKILIVSYTNDAVNELITRINHELNIPARITTFHKTGYAILRKQEMEKTRVVGEGLVFNIIRDYMHEHLINKPEELNALVLFFGYYLDYQLGKETIEKFRLQHARNDYTTLKANLKDINEALINRNQKVKKSIKHEVLRSLEEVQIANFLFLHQIDYDYEATYPYHIKGATTLYTPDFTINYEGRKVYLEHFGIHENGTHSRYSEEELARYKKSINDKIALHQSKGTKLIFTFSEYNDSRPMLEHLREELFKAGIKPTQRSLIDVYYHLKKDDDSKYLNKFILLIKDFIQAFKIDGYTEKDFKLLETRTDNVRNRMFLKLCKPIYLHYQQFLEENDMVDFEDMINDSRQILKDPKTKEMVPDFDYIIVDEYQDISQQRFDLTQELSKLTDAKIMAVGDDWQSIFAFAGSRIDLFVNFKEKMGYADKLHIDYTYRNAQQVIDIAGHFIQKNDMQIKKHLKSPKSILKPIVLYEYSDVVYKNEKKGYKGIIHEKAKICDDIIGKILQVDSKNTQIAMLARYNFEYKHFAESEFFTEIYSGNQKMLRSVKYPQAELVFMTVHGSKGLGFTNVIILNGSDEVFGFPAQLEMDPLLRLVKFDDRSYSYAEERRLFYVALTRTKNRAFILYPKTKPSTFVREIAEEYDLVTIHGDINESIPLQDRKEKACPLCGYPLQFKENRAYGLKLYMCTNEPEICSYMTNNLRSGYQSISKCDQCKDGFLIVKHSKKTDRYFFGCTNYKESGKGCNKTKVID